MMFEWIMVMIMISIVLKNFYNFFELLWFVYLKYDVKFFNMLKCNKYEKNGVDLR